MQVFNEFNARKLERGDLNILSGLCSNSMFWLIIIITFVVQYLLVQFGGRAVKLGPLTTSQHIFCFLIGFGSIFIGLMIKLLPECLFN
jgi:Ca2+ transporting ATPase